MEHLSAHTGKPFFEGGGAPTLFYVGTWNGVAHILRFGPEDQMYDVHREAQRIREEMRRGRARFDKQREKAQD